MEACNGFSSGAIAGKGGGRAFNFPLFDADRSISDRELILNAPRRSINPPAHFSEWDREMSFSMFNFVTFFEY